jgi:aquaporin Z
LLSSYTQALERHWPEYLIEAFLLGAFMVSAIGFTVLLEHPDSAARRALADPLARRALMGLAMGLTAVALIYSPWGKQSGAHFNPALTLIFYRLGKIAAPDAVFYIAAQFAGGIAGVLLAWLVLGARVEEPAVRFAVTVPGAGGAGVAFAAEAAISLGLMAAVLATTNSKRLGRYTGLFCGALVASYITFEAPLSGMSMNPARTLGSASGAGVYQALWIYFLAPPLGMWLAAETYVRAGRARRVHCAKLHHANSRRCIFHCEYGALLG